MKRLVVLTAVWGLSLSLLAGLGRGDDLFVIAGGGPAGKVLKTQVFTSSTQDTTVGDSTWAKLAAPRWTYNKVSATSYLVITYHDMLYSAESAPFASSMYQLRVNDQPSAGGESAAILACGTLLSSSYGSYAATAVWFGLAKGDVTLSVWHRQVNCSQCTQNAGPNTTSVIVMEIAN